MVTFEIFLYDFELAASYWLQKTFKYINYWLRDVKFVFSNKKIFAEFGKPSMLIEFFGLTKVVSA
jgi:hypothetical protein